MSDEICIPPGIQQKDTSFGYTLSIISGKYKMTILYYLSENKIVRFNELQRGIGTIPFKTLSVMLKELEADCLVRREEFPRFPLKLSIP